MLNRLLVTTTLAAVIGVSFSAHAGGESLDNNNAIVESHQNIDRWDLWTNKLGYHFEGYNNFASYALTGFTRNNQSRFNVSGIASHDNIAAIKHGFGLRGARNGSTTINQNGSYNEASSIEVNFNSGEWQNI